MARIISMFTSSKTDITSYRSPNTDNYSWPDQKGLCVDQDSAPCELSLEGTCESGTLCDHRSNPSGVTRLEMFKLLSNGISPLHNDRPGLSELASNDIPQAPRPKRHLTTLYHDDGDQMMSVTIVPYMSYIMGLTILQCPPTQAISSEKKIKRTFREKLGTISTGKQGD